MLKQLCQLYYHAQKTLIDGLGIDQRGEGFSSSLTLNSPAGRGSQSIAASTGHELVPALSDFTIEKNDPQLPCCIMPLSKNPDFVGRSTILKAIDNALCPPTEKVEDMNNRSGRLRTFAICGPDGIGKTQIASEFVHRHKGRFDAIFWMHGDGPSKIPQDFSSIATKLGLVAEDSNTRHCAWIASTSIKVIQATRGQKKPRSDILDYFRQRGRPRDP
jgi:hypothetical protein